MNSKDRSEIIFDKVSVTLPIEESYRLKVKDNLFQLNDKPNHRIVNRVIPDQYDRHDYRVKHYRETNGRYNHTFDINVPVNTKHGHFNFKVSIYPINKSQNFIKFEFNPTKLGANGELIIRNLLIRILGMKLARTVFYEGRLTRVDTALDCHSAVDNCYLYMKGVNCSEIIHGAGGKILSQICGSDRSDVRVTLYDKQAEQAKRLQVTTGKWFRLEIVVRNLGFPMADIRSKLENHFKKLSFYSGDFLADEYFDASFLAAVQTDGLNAALSALCRNDRVRYLRRLEKYVCEPFRLRKLTIKPGLESLKFLRSTKYVPRVTA